MAKNKDKLIKGKHILLYSPQPWNQRPVSKHNYAKTLATIGASVYFLNPIHHKAFNGRFSMATVQSGIHVIDITLPVPKAFKFHVSSLYHFFLKRYLKKINQNINHNINVYWNFDQELNIRAFDIFKDAVKIFHPVDDFNPKADIDYNVFDMCITPSEVILSKIPNKKKILINHGLSYVFESNAKAQLNSKHIKDKAPQIISYMGNLSIPFLDVNSLQNIISKFKRLTFNFIGDYDEETDFIKFLKKQENVNLVGLKLNEELVNELNSSDILILCYKYAEGYNMDNSHKILEYLSTGKVIVSSKLSYYKNLNLFPMATASDNSDYALLFDKVIKNFNHYNSIKQREKRINFSLEHTYQKQLGRIDDQLKQLKRVT